MKTLFTLHAIGSSVRSRIMAYDLRLMIISFASCNSCLRQVPPAGRTVAESLLENFAVLTGVPSLLHLINSNCKQAATILKSETFLS